MVITTKKEGFMRKFQSILFQGFTDEDWTQPKQLSGIRITSYSN